MSLPHDFGARSKSWRRLAYRLHKTDKEFILYRFTSAPGFGINCTTLSAMSQTYQTRCYVKTRSLMTTSLSAPG